MINKQEIKTLKNENNVKTLQTHNQRLEINSSPAFDNRINFDSS